MVSADRDRVAALGIRAIDQDAAHAGVAHLSEGDLLRAGEDRHAPLKRGASGETIEGFWAGIYLKRMRNKYVTCTPYKSVTYCFLCPFLIY
jgi:hypothetical protein